MTCHNKPLLACCCSLLALLFGAQTASAAHSEITAMSLEELLDLEITSVSKKAEKATDAAAAIFVVTGEDIRRSGATSLPDALRMVPGLQVAQIDANKWAMSSRGFNAFSANKLLVLMDGRTLYNPLFSGVLWNEQDTLMEDIERIEVIRGPGATLWGANAVNGVINIITKKTTDTQGGLLTAGAGSEEQGFGSTRHGGRVNDHTTYRLYAKTFYRDDLERSSGDQANDDWYQWRTGFRVDSDPGTPYSLTVQGDAYHGYADATTTIPIPALPYTRDVDNPSNIRGANLLTRLTRTLGRDSELVLQAYYDLTKSNDQLLGDHRDVVDFELQHRFRPHDRHEITWSGDYRFIRDEVKNSTTFSFDPASRSDTLLSGFIQDEITLIDELLRLTLGSKFEHNDYTGYEVQPSGRLLYTPHPRHAFWAAVSRAVRTPSRVDHHVAVQSAASPTPVDPTLIKIVGAADYDSEELLAYELGYRVQASERLAFDLAAFVNDYNRLRTIPNNPSLAFGADPGYAATLSYAAANTMAGQGYGFEIVADAKPLNRWRLQAAYTFLRLDLQEEGSGLFPGEDAEGESPRNQLSLRSMMDIGKNLSFDTWLRYVDNLPTYGIGSYLTMDARLGWQARPELELELVGKNLFDNAHPEFGSLYINTIPSEIERSVYGKITWTH